MLIRAEFGSFLHRTCSLWLAFLAAIAAACAQSQGSKSIGASPDAQSMVTIPQPAVGWVLDSNRASIASVFGNAPLEIAGSGQNPGLAGDGAGNIDGAALTNAATDGQSIARYALRDGTQASLADETTVILLCGRENNWLQYASGGSLPSKAPAGAFSVMKPGEWGLSLASTASPFAVAEAGRWWIYAAVPAPPPDATRFYSEPDFPPAGSNAQVCVWAFYDTSISGSASQPEISVAYDDGAAGTPHRLTQGVASNGNPLVVSFSQVGADLGTLFIWQGSAARMLFQQPVRAAYWNDGLRRSIASGFETRTWAGLAITNLDPRPVAQGGDALDNIRADSYSGFVRTSPFAHYSVTTPPGTPFVAIRYELGNVPDPPFEYSLSFELDGQYLGYDQPWRFGTNLRSIPLPQDGKSHTLDLTNGFTRSNANYRYPTTGSFGGGGFIDAVAAPPGYPIKVNRPATASVALVLSHSVAVGELAGSVPYLNQGPQSSIAWPVLARAANAFGTARVVDESYGGELLANDCFTADECMSYIAGIKKAQPHIALGLVARMLNDFYHGRGAFNECLDGYQQTLENLFAAWQAELPSIPLYVGSDIRESAAREAETDGCAIPMRLADWRNGIEAEVTGYAAAKNAAWLHFVDMTDWVPQNELLPGGIHPTVQGQLRICQAVAAYFRQPDQCRIPQ